MKTHYKTAASQGLISRQELARRLEVTPICVHSWIRRKIIPAPRIKRRKTHYWSVTELPTISARLILRVDEQISKIEQKRKIIQRLAG